MFLSAIHARCLSFLEVSGSEEADPLTTLFIKARCMAFVDVPNLFALPQPNMDELVPVEEVGEYTKQEYTTRLMEAGSFGKAFLHSDPVSCFSQVRGCSVGTN